MGSFGILLLSILNRLLDLYAFIILAAALISWLYLPPSNAIVRALRFLTEPVLAPCRRLLTRILPFQWRRFDFSPVLAILLVQIVRYIISYILTIL